MQAVSIQFNSKPGEVKTNLERAADMIRAAENRGADLIVLPELFNVGYDFDLLPEIEYDYSATRSFLSQLARELNVVIAGGVLEVEGENWYNSVVVFDGEGAVATSYRKISLFPLSGEQEIFEAGDSLATFSLGALKFGIMTCFDIRFPELGREYWKRDCDGLIVPAAFPLPRLDHWRNLIKSLAIQNQMYVIAANRVGEEDNLQFLGNSCIIDPWGTIKATADTTEETAVEHNLSRKKVVNVRQDMPCRENFEHLNNLFN